MSTCSRTGCTKTLRSNNTTGHCATNCESPEAPASSRAKGVEGGKPARRSPRATAETVAGAGSDGGARFRAVHDAMGMDPEKTLEEFYASWLEGIRQALES